jgi:hypothetical protein
MLGIELEIYVGMINKLISSGLITQRIGDQLTSMLDNKKFEYKAKRHITDLLSLLSSIESMTQ